LVINLVGAEIFRFGDLRNIISTNHINGLKPIEFPRSVAVFLVLHLVTKMFPDLINKQQYQLLFSDNVADVAPLLKLLERPLQPTREFFMHELIHKR
jgi:hypothetical protein